MDIFNILSLCGGLAFFLFGMRVMSTGLEKMSGSKLESTLKTMTASPFRSMALGAGITIAIQSSSALTVMLVGLVNSGIMQLGQTVSVIMGSNIGTTLTAWLLSLTGIESDNIFIKMLKPTSFSPIIALIGILLLTVAKNGRKKDVGSIMLGFAILMYGMSEMSHSVEGLAKIPGFADVMTMFNNPLMGVLVGALITAVIQASAASVGMLQALAMTGSISVGMAVPIIMGQNIGTCITALLSSIGTSRNAKRVAAVHIYFNLVGTVIFLPLFLLYTRFIDRALYNAPIDAFGIAIAHSAFNLLATLVLFPFGKLLEKLAVLTVRDKKNANSTVIIDDRLLITPSVAISECRHRTVEMATLAFGNLKAAKKLLHEYSESEAEKVAACEETIDGYEDMLGSFLVKLSARELTDENSTEVAKLLHIIGDIERISDHANNLKECANERHEKNAEFSPIAVADLNTLETAIDEILSMTLDALETDNVELASHIEPLEQVIDALNFDIKARHIARLQQGECTITLGFILSDILTNLERVSDHCSNIAICLMQNERKTISAHEYVIELKTAEGGSFADEVSDYAKKYELTDKVADVGHIDPVDAELIRNNM